MNFEIRAVSRHPLGSQAIPIPAALETFSERRMNGA